MGLALLPTEWQRWLLTRLEHGGKPAELLRELVQQGHVSLHNAMQAIDEVCGTRRLDAARAAQATAAAAAAAAPRVVLPQIDVRRSHRLLPGPPVELRFALQSPHIAVLDGVLDAPTCALLRSLAGAQPQWQAGQRPGALPSEANPSQLALQALQLRLAALLDQPASHFEPLQIRRWQAGDAAPPPAAGPAPASAADHPPAGAGAPADDAAGRRLGCFVLTLAAPQRGGALCFAAAGGVLAPPHAGGAVWVQALRADGQPDSSALYTQQPVRAGVLWQATLWLRERPWPNLGAALP
jgi:hypothetical protein